MNRFAMAQLIFIYFFPLFFPAISAKREFIDIISFRNQCKRSFNRNRSAGMSDISDDLSHLETFARFAIGDSLGTALQTSAGEDKSIHVRSVDHTRSTAADYFHGQETAREFSHKCWNRPHFSSRRLESTRSSGEYAEANDFRVLSILPRFVQRRQARNVELPENSPKLDVRGSFRSHPAQTALLARHSLFRLLQSPNAPQKCNSQAVRIRPEFRCLDAIGLWHSIFGRERWVSGMRAKVFGYYFV